MTTDSSITRGSSGVEPTTSLGVAASAGLPQIFEAHLCCKLFAELQSAFGVDFAGYKQITIERRVQRRMALHRLDRLADYVRYVQSNAAELHLLFDDLLIGVTGFFRD